MTIVKWDPFRNVAALQDRINRIFDESFSRTGDIDDDISMSAWKPLVDIYETDEAIILKAELPGIKKEDVSVEIKDNVLTLKGERIEDKEVKKVTFEKKDVSERSAGRLIFSTAFNLIKSRQDLKTAFLKLKFPNLKKKSQNRLL